MRQLTLFALFVAAIGCEKDPTTREEKNAQYERKEQKRLDSYEGKTLYIAVEDPTAKDDSHPLYSPVYSGAHLRLDCPKIINWKKRESLTIRAGKLVDAKGFYQKQHLCDTCVE